MAGIDNNTILYLRGDSFMDLSLNPKTLTQGSGISVLDGKISISNPTKGLILSTAETLNGDFTFEWWTNINSTSGLNTFVNRETAGFFLVGHYATSKSTISNWVGTGAGSTTWDVVSGQFLDNPNLNTDTHYAFVRKGGTYYSFKNGKLISQQDASIVSLGLNNSSIGDTSSQTIWNVRISNVARWTEEFTPPTRRYNSIQIDIKKQTETKIDFNVSKLGNETINKINILVNGTVSKTYKTTGDLIYDIDNSLYRLGENKITIRVTYDGDYIEEEVLTYICSKDELSNSTNLKDVIDRYDLINNTLNMEMSNFKNVLIRKGVECSEDNKITDLINKVDNMQIRKYGTGIFKPIYSVPRTRYGPSSTYTTRATYTINTKEEYVDCVRITSLSRKQDGTTGASHYYYLGVYINNVLIKELISTPSNLDATSIDYLTLKKGDVIEVKTKSPSSYGYIEFTLEFGYVSEDLAD